MKAVTYDRHGDVEVLSRSDVGYPECPPDGVIVAVGAVSVNRGPDIETRSRGFSMDGVEMPHIGGVDPAGEIVEVGSRVDGHAVGDRVAVYPVIACGECAFCLEGAPENYCANSRLFGVQTQGGRAEFAAVPATQLVPLPDSVSFETAAALGVAYTTTWHGIVERARTDSNDTLLVVGAGGACGVATVQLGSILGARVIAVTGARWKHDRLRALGASDVFSYRDADWPDHVRAATGGRGATVAFDNSGTRTFAMTVSCLARAGRLVCSGGTTGFDIELNIRDLYRRLISLLFYVQGAKADMARLVALAASGDLVPVVDSRFPMTEAAAADTKVESGNPFGRVVMYADPAPRDQR